MKKIGICLLIVAILTCSSCSSDKDMYSQMKIGMDYDAFFNVVSDADSLGYYGYIFLESEDGNNIVAEFDIDGKTLTRKEKYNKVTDIYVENFERITSGMTVFEVVRLLGLPVAKSDSEDVRSLDFGDANASYRVIFDKDMKVSETEKLS